MEPRCVEARRGTSGESGRRNLPPPVQWTSGDRERGICVEKGERTGRSPRGRGGNGQKHMAAEQLCGLQPEEDMPPSRKDDVWAGRVKEGPAGSMSRRERQAAAQEVRGT